MTKKNIAKPIEITERIRKRWEESGYKCITEVSENEDIIKQDIILCVKACFKECPVAYIVIWFYDLGISQSYYNEHFRTFRQVYISRDCVIYRIYPGDDLNIITSVWGECDILDIIFFRDEQDSQPFLGDLLGRSYKEYRKDFFKRVSASQVIISDSGDGDEFQMIFSEDLYEKLQCLHT